jgi:hypothetical protein
MNSAEDQPDARPNLKKYVRAVGPRLRVLLYFIFGLVAIIAANSVYLSTITYLEWLKSDPNSTYQNWFYMAMFGTHLALGLLIVLPIVIFGILHIKNAHDRPNRRAVKVGYLLFATSLVVLITGLLLMRVDIFQFKNVGLKNPHARSLAYWIHVIAPILAAWLYILHRLAGPRIKWRVGLRWGVAVGVIVVGMVVLHSAHPKKNPIGSVEGEKYFEPSLARTATGNFIPARTLESAATTRCSRLQKAQSSFILGWPDGPMFRWCLPHRRRLRLPNSRSPKRQGA